MHVSESMSERSTQTPNKLKPSVVLKWMSPSTPKIKRNPRPRRLFPGGYTDFQSKLQETTQYCLQSSMSRSTDETMYTCMNSSDSSKESPEVLRNEALQDNSLKAYDYSSGDEDIIPPTPEPEHAHFTASKMSEFFKDTSL